MFGGASGLTIFFIVLLIFLLLGGAGTGIYFLYKHYKNKDNKTVTVTTK